MLSELLDEIPKFFSYYNIVFMLEATLRTLALTGIGLIIGFTIGVGLAIVRVFHGLGFVLPRFFAISYVEFFRRVPFLVTLMLVFFFFQVFKLDVTVFTVAAITVFLISASYIAEIVRAGFESVHAAQWEAGTVMNFTLLQILRDIVIPQSWRVILPPAFSFFIAFIKNIALASQIGVMELTYAGKVLNSKGFSASLVYGTILAIYFLISYPFGRLGKWMEEKLAFPKH